MFNQIGCPIQISESLKAFGFWFIIDNTVILYACEITEDIFGFIKMVLAGISLTHFYDSEGYIRPCSKH